MNTTIYKLYYSILGSGLLVAMMFTIYFGGLVVVRSSEQASLSAEQRSLASTKQELNEKIARETSLQQLSSTVENSGFQPISAPLIVSDHASVALR